MLNQPTLAYYEDEWRFYKQHTLDFAKLESHAHGMVAYVYEMGDYDPDGFIRVWVHTFAAPFAALRPKEKPEHHIICTQIARDLNTHREKKTSGTYYLDTHAANSDVLGIYYKEPLEAK